MWYCSPIGVQTAWSGTCHLDITMYVTYTQRLIDGYHEKKRKQKPQTEKKEKKKKKTRKKRKERE